MDKRHTPRLTLVWNLFDHSHKLILPTVTYPTLEAAALASTCIRAAAPSSTFAAAASDATCAGPNMYLKKNTLAAATSTRRFGEPLPCRSP